MKVGRGSTPIVFLHEHPALVVVMGVSGARKMTIANLLAKRLGCPMLEGDSQHSVENIRRMAAGVAWTDDDRYDWLFGTALHIAEEGTEGQNLLVACSALKRRYRDILRQHAANLIFVHLSGDKQIVDNRLSLRHNHFMSPKLLDSQFAALEMLGPDELAIRCDISNTPASPLNRFCSSCQRCSTKALDKMWNGQGCRAGAVGLLRRG